jgi:hypothetical protein
MTITRASARHPHIFSTAPHQLIVKFCPTGVDTLFGSCVAGRVGALVGLCQGGTMHMYILVKVRVHIYIYIYI